MENQADLIAKLTADPETQHAIQRLLGAGQIRFLTIKKAAMMVGLSERTIERALTLGELKRWHPGPVKTRVDRHELLQWFSRKYPLAEFVGIGGSRRDTPIDGQARSV